MAKNKTLFGFKCEQHEIRVIEEVLEDYPKLKEQLYDYKMNSGVSTIKVHYNHGKSHPVLKLHSDGSVVLYLNN